MSMQDQPESPDHDQTDVPRYALKRTRLADGRKAIVIRTSDRLTFKRCRRKWAFSSHLKRNLGTVHRAAPLWFGSAFHYALEDYHGYNVYGRPADALTAFCYATAQNFKTELPPGASELLDLGRKMLDYYVDSWLSTRQMTRTYWEEVADPVTGEITKVPQVEVSFSIPLPIPRETLDLVGADVVLYNGTIDRVAIDENGHLWVVEYKTAKRAEHMHYLTDPQVSAYMWAAQLIYNKPVVGVIYYQFVKKAPEGPPLLTSGKISTNSQMTTSLPLYREAIVRMYGDPSKAPKANVDFMWSLAENETEHKDKYIQRELVYRNQFNSHTELQKIMLELEDILNPDLPLYPNPTRDCSFTCSFLSACVSLDDGSDWEAELRDGFAPRGDMDEHYWRRKLLTTQEIELMRSQGFPDLELVNMQMAKIPKPEGFNFDASLDEFAPD